MIACAIEALDRVISRIHRVENQEPLLRKRKCKKGSAVSKGAKRERGRRRVERGVFERLSQYYPCPEGKTWSTVDLLSKGKQ